jgi:NAD(P)-dependent dehydrogenase (short-subunit alcohol dehydrogenase family)
MLDPDEWQTGISAEDLAMSARLAGQVAWISGAASGIGAATARLFASEGASVAIVDVCDQDGEQLVNEIASSGGKAMYSHCDVASSEQVRLSIESTVAQFGSLNIVVNCAGIVHVGLLHEYSEDDWDQLMAVNVKGIFFSLTQAFPHFQKIARSYMVNVGSISSHVGQRLTPAYTTSKGAVLSLTQSIALDYASMGLRCNCVSPGITDTPMLRKHLNTTPDPDATLRQRVRRVPMNRAMHPDDIARSILYLSCEDSSGISGTTIVVDGGYLAAGEWDTVDDSMTPGSDA